SLPLPRGQAFQIIRALRFRLVPKIPCLLNRRRDIPGGFTRDEHFARFQMEYRYQRLPGGSWAKADAPRPLVFAYHRVTLCRLLFDPTLTAPPRQAPPPRPQSDFALAHRRRGYPLHPRRALPANAERFGPCRMGHHMEVADMPHLAHLADRQR